MPDLVIAAQDMFLRLFSDALSPLITYNQAVRREGQHVYFFVNAVPHQYAKGPSFVHYIGYTDSPPSRFPRHDRLKDHDSIMLLPLDDYLRRLKETLPVWRRLGEGQRQISMEMERVFIYIFKECCGDIPVRNIQEPEPTHRSQLIAQFILDFAKRIHRSREIAKQIAELAAELQQTQSSLPGKVVQDTNSIPVLTPSTIIQPTSKRLASVDNHLSTLSCEEAILEWFRRNTRRNEKVDVRRMYDDLQGAGFKRNTIRTTRSSLLRRRMLCQDGAVDSYFYRLSERCR